MYEADIYKNCSWRVVFRRGRGVGDGVGVSFQNTSYKSGGRPPELSPLNFFQRRNLTTANEFLNLFSCIILYE